MNYVESDLIICALLWLLFHVLSVFAPRRFKLSMRTKRMKAKKKTTTTKQQQQKKTNKKNRKRREVGEQYNYTQKRDWLIRCSFSKFPLSGTETLALERSQITGTFLLPHPPHPRGRSFLKMSSSANLSKTDQVLGCRCLCGLCLSQQIWWQPSFDTRTTSVASAICRPRPRP